MQYELWERDDGWTIRLLVENDQVVWMSRQPLGTAVLLGHKGTLPLPKADIVRVLESSGYGLEASWQASWLCQRKENDS